MKRLVLFCESIRSNRTDWRCESPGHLNFQAGKTPRHKRELSELLSTYYLCAKANSPSLSQNLLFATQLGIRKSTQFFWTKFFGESFGSWMSAAKNCERPHQIVCFPAAPVLGKNFLSLGIRVSGRKGQECPQEIRTKKIMFMLLFSMERFMLEVCHTTK